MRVLACIPFHHYGTPSLPLSYTYVAEVLRHMGHRVDVFEFIEQGRHNREGMNEFFVDAVRHIGYDLVFVETSSDEFLPEALEEARRHTVTLAWNSDDDWRWESYSSQWCSHYTYMVTTYRHIYESNKQAFPNLLLSQWGCPGLSNGLQRDKDIPFSFVGGVYGERDALLRACRRRTGLVVYSGQVPLDRSVYGRARRKLGAQVYGSPVQPAGLRLDYGDVVDIWERSRVSLTPLEASRSGHLQIKGRVFEMGLSGTVMLCTHNPALAEFYAPGREYVEFQSVEECSEKARYLLAHETERRSIAEAYHARTSREHLWEHRYRRLFAEIGLTR